MRDALISSPSTNQNSLCLQLMTWLFFLLPKMTRHPSYHSWYHGKQPHRGYVPWIRIGDGHWCPFSALQSHPWLQCWCQSPLRGPWLRLGITDLARRLTVIAYERYRFGQSCEAQIHTVTALDAAQRLAFRSSFSLPMSWLIWPSPKSTLLCVWTRPLISKHQGDAIPRHLRDGHYSGSRN